MTLTIYQSLENPALGFSVSEENQHKYNTKKQKLVNTGKKTYNVWIDEFEGGNAYQDDWSFVEEFKSDDKAMKYLKEKYGDVKKIKTLNITENFE